MSVRSIDNSLVSANKKNYDGSKNINSGKIFGFLLGATIAGANFLKEDKDNHFIKINTGSAKFNSVASFALASFALIFPLVVFGSVLDNIVDNFKKENTVQKIDTFA